MVALLPEKKHDLASLLTRLNADTFREVLKRMSYRNVHVSARNKLLETAGPCLKVQIPKMKTDAKSELSDVLQGLGMTNAFSKAANFSRMAQLQPDDKLWISRVMQRCYIEVGSNRHPPVQSFRSCTLSPLHGLFPFRFRSQQLIGRRAGPVDPYRHRLPAGRMQLRFSIYFCRGSSSSCPNQTRNQILVNEGKDFLNFLPKTTCWACRNLPPATEPIAPPPLRSQCSVHHRPDSKVRGSLDR